MRAAFLTRLNFFEVNLTGFKKKTYVYFFGREIEKKKGEKRKEEKERKEKKVQKEKKGEKRRNR